MVSTTTLDEVIVTQGVMCRQENKDRVCSLRVLQHNWLEKVSQLGLLIPRPPLLSICSSYHGNYFTSQVTFTFGWWIVDNKAAEKSLVGS